MIIAVKIKYIIRFSNEIIGRTAFKNSVLEKSGFTINNIKDINTIAISPEVEANEMYPPIKNTVKKTKIPNTPTTGVKNKTTPIEVAIALPPPNFR
jgi:hypothetical protein